MPESDREGSPKAAGAGAEALAQPMAAAEVLLAGAEAAAAAAAARAAEVETAAGETVYYVNGLSNTVTEDELRDFFKNHGRVSRCNIVQDPRTLAGRGFAFVSIATDDPDKIVDELNNTDLNGRRLNVEKAKRGRPRTPTPGRYLGRARVGRDGRDRYDPYERRDYRDRRDDYRPRYDDDRRDRYDRYDDRRGGYDRGYDDRRGGYDDRRGYDRYDDRRGYDRYDDRRGYDPYRA
eukprot:CAMPEP_0177650358 /NCGR_PEP_ID=MMETSP0447-20121125/11898_1 /TAXON_ID=0 /ORGANISM="Stygamoeba regulata, Strain BSH-02190019" /LENGTH=234 /DNA_ID=CAMNT_0019153219 /DNA_START=45 /DNA_END=745 /DNA_ORIENTATION=-